MEEEKTTQEKNEGNKKEPKKRSFQKDVDVKMFVKEGINVAYFEKAIEQLNIDLSPMECVLYMGKLKMEGAKINASNVEEAKKKYKELSSEIHRQIKEGEIDPLEVSQEYYMRCGVSEFVNAFKNVESKTPVQAFSRKIAERYMDIETAEKTFRGNYQQSQSSQRSA